MPNKQEKILQREQKILCSACDLIAEEGFFNLKMSDVAKRAGVSVGTLYVHFVSKEDLSLAIAAYIYRKRYAFFKLINEHFENPVEKSASFLIADVIVNKTLGEIAEMESLALFPSVWKRASIRRVEEGRLACQEIGNLVTDVVQSALDQNLLTAQNDQAENLTDCINASLWGVSMGLHQVFNSYGVQQEHFLKGADEMDIYFLAINALLKGFGYQHADFVSRLREINTELEEIERANNIL